MIVGSLRSSSVFLSKNYRSSDVLALGCDVIIDLGDFTKYPFDASNRTIERGKTATIERGRSEQKKSERRGGGGVK